MNPKLICCFLILLLTGLASCAQDRRTLQISETDTVLLNLTSVEYVISIAATAPFSAMDNSQNKRGTSGSEEPAVSMQTVKSLLQNHHITWETSREKGYTIGRSFFQGGDSPITITVHSEPELKSVYKLLSPLSGITASIGQVEYEAMPDRVSIYKTLYQRALADAIAMAAISGKTLGDLIAVEEPQDPLWSMSQMMESIEPAANFVAAMAGNQRARLQKKVETKMLFKFELK
jgi:hypothetical protein